MCILALQDQGQDTHLELANYPGLGLACWVLGLGLGLEGLVLGPVLGLEAWVLVNIPDLN